MTTKRKPKTNRTEQPRSKPAATFSPRDIKCLGHLNNLSTNLGLDRRPLDTSEAVANARTLKSIWGNGGAHKLPGVIAHSSDNVNHLLILRGSSLEKTAKTLVEELRRDVPKVVSNHPGWQGFIDKMSSAIGA